jgi:hypothetical protein
MPLCEARSSGVRGGRRPAKYDGAPTAAISIGPATRTAIISDDTQRFGPIMASNPDATSISSASRL